MQQEAILNKELSETKNKREITTKTLGPFFGITFGLCWGLGILMVLLPQMEKIFGPMGYTNPIFILMVWAPAIASIILISRYYGLSALKSFFSRLLLWRMSVAWWMVLLIAIPAVFYLAAMIKGTFPAPFPFSPWYNAISTIAIALFIGPMEEFGWRGFALPLLQRKYTPFIASIVLGVIWAVWHLPSFFMSGTPQSSWSFGYFFLGVIAMALILTPMFNKSKGSLLIAFLFHFMLNNPIWPDAQPYDSFFFALIAIGVVLINRKNMFSKINVVTDELSPNKTTS